MRVRVELESDEAWLALRKDAAVGVFVDACAGAVDAAPLAHEGRRRRVGACWLHRSKLRAVCRGGRARVGMRFRVEARLLVLGAATPLRPGICRAGSNRRSEA